MRVPFVIQDDLTVWRESTKTELEVSEARVDLGKSSDDVAARCICGTQCMEKKHMKHFLAQHPSKCTARRAYAKQLATGTRSVTDWKP